MKKKTLNEESDTAAAHLLISQSQAGPRRPQTDGSGGVEAGGVRGMRAGERQWRLPLVADLRLEDSSIYVNAEQRFFTLGRQRARGERTPNIRSCQTCGRLRYVIDREEKNKQTSSEGKRIFSPKAEINHVVFIFHGQLR